MTGSRRRAQEFAITTARRAERAELLCTLAFECRHILGFPLEINKIIVDFSHPKNEQRPSATPFLDQTPILKTWLDMILHHWLATTVTKEKVPIRTLNSAVVENARKSSQFLEINRNNAAAWYLRPITMRREMAAYIRSQLELNSGIRSQLEFGMNFRIGSSFYAKLSACRSK